ncbi:hypothetical protein R1flu_022237 [Riccia fluitans]|uniref:TOD1/MUCI70 glycosyltransferase-like domain-containing protein n=1 Tax=Riccia fluitans TaxID=41844 RepID=A0ABD1ZUP1_9MARC
MALFRQVAGPFPVGVASPSGGDHRPGSPFRLPDHNAKTDLKGYGGLMRSRSIKRRPGRSSRSRRCSLGAIVLILLVGVVVTIFGADHVFPLMRNLKGSETLEFGHADDGSRKGENEADRASDFGQNGKGLSFEQNVNGDMDAKYRGSHRLEKETEFEDDFESILPRLDRSESETIDDVSLEREREINLNGHKASSLTEVEDGDSEVGGQVFNSKAGLHMGERLKDQFGEKIELGEDGGDVESSVKTSLTNGDRNEVLDRKSNLDRFKSREGSEDENPDESLHRLSRQEDLKTDDDPRLVDFLREAKLYAHETDPSLNLDQSDSKQVSNASTLARSGNTSDVLAGVVHEHLDQVDETTRDDDEEDQVQPEQSSGKSKKPRKKRSAPPCEISFRNSTKGLREPTDASSFESFSLTYRQREEKPAEDPSWVPRFAGHQTLSEREESFLAKDHEDLHCGFVRGPKEYPGTGFEISKEDMDYLQSCHIAVSSCIFGNYDHIRNPSGKKVTSASKKKVCFAMFVDQPSLAGMIEEGEIPDENMNLGLWRIVLIKNMPYTDNRRTGKVPKFLTHRLFPNARYSVWLDSKLRLQSDPLLILEYFLWRGHHEYAISNHYDRHCVWEEVEQNKKLNKYNHSVIDEQFAFYKADGLTRFNASDPNKLLASHVPEGSFIVRAHTPISNLFSCLWFNEVDRFTSRDQLSFAYTYMKLVRTNPKTNFRLNMFKDCERKAIAKLFRHKAEDAVVKSQGRKD